MTTSNNGQKISRRSAVIGTAGVGALAAASYWIGGVNRVSRSLGKKVIVIGIDGMDPRLSRKMMSAGFLQSGLEQYGVQAILANSGIRAYAQMLTALKQGRIVCVMLDQGIGTAENGMVHRFLGKDMSMSAGPAQLARASRAPVLPVAMKVAAPVWKFEIQPPIPLGSGSLESDVELMTRWTESQILRTPQFWSWHHRRWCHLPIAPPHPATLPGTQGEGHGR